ncbi:autotransporter outer membrane beta-barrel domain-containing protein [Escherichia albertii]|uniref:autotransporter outer membrane beta-barrel domain-containing protein n=1 Tax=Escherichia albertii TaxID=208962 RepID=UPI000F5F33D9|nr:autotransporter outer membrane beta-barrel domain-containing protein [Escherichia albertii]QSZ83441.1 autotransporter outer membrane beta-barrel domain-containing protein [Escherichia albertii]QSZ87805.1 autotransporter outer membrane beta-barrel domain-containing protein [Escherichia albertii]QSZ92181.1 autotransporter outer membrane beta-barrel domain-containing protein [Escherichia albertii]QSZ96598.1 autotransporter outer membrane beta-barrel domain-containing protein [Escherichia albert
MHSWKKKLVVSQLALACTLAITSQANAKTYDTFGYHDNTKTVLDWANMPVNGDGDYITYSGFVYNNAASGDFDTTFSGDTVNGIISTYYLNHDYADNSANTLNITNSTIHGDITSDLPFGWYSYDSSTDTYSGYEFNNGTTVAAHDWVDNDTFTLNISNSTIDDDYEALYFTDTYLDADGKTVKSNAGWATDDQNVDHLSLTLNNSKWVGAALFDYETVNPANFYDIAANSLEPSSSSADAWGRVNSADTFQSGIFDVKLVNGSEWDTTKSSLIDTLTVDGASQVNVADSSLTSDSIVLTNGSSMNIGKQGDVDTDHLTIDSYSTVNLDTTAVNYGDTALYANTITVNNGGVLDVNVDQYDANPFQTEKLELTNGGVFDIHSSDYILNADLVNGHTNDTSKSNYGYGVIAMNSDGHLTVNGNSDLNSGDEADASSVNDNVVAATGNYKVRIDNATGTGAIAGYKDKEIIYVNDANTNATFSAANKADLGAYTYQAEQKGNTVVLQQMELTDYANMALSIPSANTNIWNLEQDTVGTRLTNSRHGLADNGGAWVSYFGGNFNGDNGTINYDQDVNGIMVGVDTKVDGNNAKWIIGAAAGFAKGDMNDRTGQVDQDSQSAYIYSSAHFANNIFVDGNLSYSHFNNDLNANMSDGTYVDGSTNSDAWGFGVKLGYDWKVGDAGYVTPYGSISGLFQSGDDYNLSNDMKVDGQSYDSMRYELGVDAGYTFTYSEDQALTPYFKLAYVYDDSNNDADVNGDSIDNGTEGSAVRVGLGTQFSFTKNFSAYTDANYLGGGDVDQDWSANVGVKYTW